MAVKDRASAEYKARAAQRQREYRARHPDKKRIARARTPEDSARDAAKYLANKTAGLCVNNCKSPARPGKVLCAECGSDNGRQARRAAKRLAAGLCRSCSAPVKAGRQHCETCLAARCNAQLARTAALKAAGLCVGCARPARPGKTKCGACKQNNAHGLTPDQAGALLAEQQGTCKLCGVLCDWTIGAAQPRVDHSHETGCVRGVLCHQCNMNIGGLETLLRRGLLAQTLTYIKEPEPA